MPYRKIDDVVLKDGQPAELGVVIAPDFEWREKLCAYLNASPQPEGLPLHWVLLTYDFAGLEARYFVMLREGEIVGCIVTTDGASVGYINSTFVSRSRRQMGIAGNLMVALENDFSGRGGKVRFLTTRTGSPAERMFEKLGYCTVWEGSGRTGMEKHYGGGSWEDYFCLEPDSLRVVDMAWAHWLPHRALMWTRKGRDYHPLDGDFLSRIRESTVEERALWKALAAPDGRLVGSAVLRLQDRWVRDECTPYVLDLYVHPRFQDATESLFEAGMPQEGHVQVFLDGASDAQIGFLMEKGFRLETSLREDFNHHDPNAPYIRVYGKRL